MFHLYSKYYFIPWPESQRFEDIDPDGEHTMLTAYSEGIFAEVEWLDNLDSDKLR